MTFVLGISAAAVGAIAAAGLVFVTVALVWFTRTLAAATTNLVTATKDLVSESAEARSQSVLPSLAIDVGWFGRFAYVDLHNVGPGAAVDVDVTLEWHKNSRSDAELYGDASRMWRTNVLPPGARHRFKPPSNERGSLMTAADLTYAANRITLTGTVKDVLGNIHEVRSEIPALAELVTGEEISQRQVLPTAPDERIAYELSEIRKVLRGDSTGAE